jgi:hypothetical protein
VLDCLANLRQLNTHVCQNASGDAVPFSHQTKENVLSANVVVIEPMRFFLRKRQDLACALGELLEFVGHLGYLDPPDHPATNVSHEVSECGRFRPGLKDDPQAGAPV